MLLELLQRRSLDNPGVSLTDPEAWFATFGGGPTKSRVTVTPEKALTYAALVSGVMAVSEDIGKLPLEVMRELPDGGHERVDDDRRAHLLGLQPNPYQHVMEWLSMMQSHTMLSGVSYAEIERDGHGDPIGLWPITPARVTPELVDGRLLHWVTVKGVRRVMPPDRLLVNRGWYLELGQPISLLDLAREDIATGLAAGYYVGGTFGRGARPSAVIEVSSQLSEPAYARLKKHVQTWQDGLDNEGRMLLLEEGAKFREASMTNEAAELMGVLGWGVQQIARFLRIPPYKLGLTDKPSHLTIEAQQLEYLLACLDAWIRRWELALRIGLFRPEESLRPRFNWRAMLRLDFKGQNDAISVGVTGGYVKLNEARQWLGLNPLPPEVGDVVLSPLNLVKELVKREQQRGLLSREAELLLGLESIREGSAPAARRETRENGLTAAQARSVAARRRAATAFAEVLADVASRFVRREVAQLRSLTRFLRAGDLAGFQRAAEAVWTDLEQRIPPSLAPHLRGLLTAIRGEVEDEVGTAAELGEQALLEAAAAGIASAHVARSRAQLGALFSEQPDDPAAAVEGRLDEWAERRGGKIGALESVRQSNAFALAAYAALGVAALRWVGGDCPLCKRLDGRVVGTRHPFVNQGDTIEAEGSAPLEARQPVTHPPLHGGCDCQIVGT